MKHKQGKKLMRIVAVFVAVCTVLTVLVIAGCSKSPAKNPAAQEAPQGAASSQPSSQQVTGAASVVEAKLVNGVQEATLSWGKLNYNPETIKAKKGVPLRITADMQRLSGCFQSFRIADLGVTKAFTENDNVIEFTPQKSGTFTFGCSMGMGAGKLIVE